MAKKEYLVKCKCFYDGAIKNVGDVVYIEEGTKINTEIFCLRKEYKVPKEAPEFLPKGNGGVMSKAKHSNAKRIKLEQQAQVFGIKYNKNTETEELERLIKDYQSK